MEGQRRGQVPPYDASDVITPLEVQAPPFRPGSAPPRLPCTRGGAACASPSAGNGAGLAGTSRAFPGDEEIVDEFKPLREDFEKLAGEARTGASIANRVAIAHFRLGNRAAAIRRNNVASTYDRTLDGVAWLTRGLRGACATEESAQFTILMEGVWQEEWSDDGEECGFFNSYIVVADDLDEVVSMAAEFEPIEVQDTLERDESKIERRPLDQPESLLKGVYQVSAWILFPPDDEEMDE